MKKFFTFLLPFSLLALAALNGCSDDNTDTPDPTHARFESSEPRKETDMFFYEEGTSIDLSKTADARTDEDVFDNLESLADETPAQAAATPEDENGGAAE